jgi:hypothetical protein
MLNALNTKYIVLPQESSVPGFTALTSFRDQPAFIPYNGFQKIPLFIYRNEHFLTRAFWADGVVQASDDVSATNLVLNRNVSSIAIVQSMYSSQSPEQKAQLAESLGRLGDFSVNKENAPSSSDKAGVVQSYNDYKSFHLQNAAPRYLVISEVWHPGWRAELDGQFLQIFKTDLALMGALIPAGDHMLELTYRPLYWKTALVLSALGGTAFVILAAYVIFRSKQTR